MHHKKSEAQIGKESSGTSSDFHPRPSPLFLHQPHQHHHNQPNQHRNHRFPPTHNPTAAAAPPSYNPNGPPLPSTPHKRPVMTAPAAAGSTLPLRSRAAPAAAATATAAAVPAEPDSQVPRLLRFRIPCSAATKAAVGHLLRRLRVRVRLLLLISFPSIYLLLTAGGATSGKGGGWSLLFDFLSALAFSSALLLLLAIYFNVIPLSSLRLIFTRSSSFLLPRHFVHRHLRRQSPPPVLWSIGDPGEKQKTDKNRPSSGLWVQVYSNGDVYEGEFHRGKCTGSGVYHYYMSGRYEGDWVDDKYDGYGVETWARGSRYRGQYRQGLRHGFGIYRFYTGDVYAGEWSNGQSHGSGVHTCEDGSRYVGEFKWGVKHGLGHYHFRNGDTYSGEYFADKMHGFGIYRFANGHRYEGAWHEGKRQGLGMYTFRNGDTQSGHWQNGVLNTLSTQNILPGSSVAVNHSKVLNAIQEARRAAERAFDIPRVDDRVNKAVAAANKAANAARVAAVKAVQKRMPNKSDDIPIPIV